MLKISKNRHGCRDVFHAFLVKNATYSGTQEIPNLRRENVVPAKIISFSKVISSKDYDSWVCFYEDDAAFERLWNNPKKYLPILKRFKGVITPDFSVYRDMPLVMQEWNIFRSRAIGHWLQENGVRVIPNIRWGDSRTYGLCCAGISQGGVIAIGSHGCIKSLEERKYFINGLGYVVTHLHPKVIVVYGKTPQDVFGIYENLGIKIVQFDSDISLAHRKEVSQ